MFKGIVIEIKNNYAIVMKDDGTMVRIKNKGNLNIGDSIFFLHEDIYDINTKNNKTPINKWIISVGLVAAMVMIMFTPLFKMLNHNVIDYYALLTVDINPSVELTLNSEGEIVTAKGLNDDGSNLDLKEIEGLNVNDGIEALKQLFNEGEFLVNNNSVLVGFSFMGNNDDINFETNIQNAVKKTFDTFNVAYLKGTDDDVKVAESLGISLGKYEAELELDDDLLEEVIENLTVEQIIELLRNKPDVTFWDEDVIDELQDELEDRLEENEKEDEDNDDDNDEDEDDDDLEDEEDEDND